MKLLVVLASVRRGRNGKKVADWFVDQSKQGGEFDVDLVDLKELDLSYELSEILPSQVKNSEYEDEKDRIWAQHVNDADAIAFVSSEYNHGMPASLKNALDHLSHEWHGKPVGFVGYGSSGAPYAQADLGLVSTWLKFDIVSARVGIGEIWAAFDEQGNLAHADYHKHTAKTVLNALAAKAESK